MVTRNRKLTGRLNRFERLELRAMLASDFSWNNANWDSLAGGLSPSINSEAYYGFEDSQIALKMATNKLVVGFDQVSTQLPESFREDFGLGGRARIYQTTEPITAQLLSSIEQIPGVSFTAPVYVSSSTGSEMALLDEFIVKLRSGVSAENFFAALPDVASYRPLEGTTDQYVGRYESFTGRKALDRTNLLVEHSLVDWVEPNFYQNWERFYTPNDPRLVNQWHLNNTGVSGGLADADVDIPEAWDINQGGSSSIVIAVIDDGIQSAHPDLNSWVNPGEVAGDGIDNDGNGWIDDIRGWNFVLGNNQTEPLGTDMHGTSVAGVAAARGDNSLGVAGAAYNSRVISIKIFDGSGVASTANIAAALRYAAGIKASGTGTWAGGDLVNNSWGGGSASATINNALISGTTTGRSGIGATYLFASGNGFAASVSQPAAQSASIPGVIAVGATNNRGARSNYSNYGAPLDFVAPSNDTRAGYLAIDTTDRTGADGYATGDYTGTGSTGFGGTSSATPLSSGIAALALAQADVRGVSISPANLRNLMRNNTDLIGGVSYSISTGKNNEFGYGRINAASLLSGIGSAEISVVNTTTELVSGSNLNMGTINFGQTVDATLRIRNQGTEGLVISSITVPAGFTLVNFTPSTIPLGGTLQLQVRFSPTVPGSYSGSLVINSNDANESAYSIQVSAVASSPRILGSVFEDFNNNASFDTSERVISSTGFAYLDTNNNAVFDTGEQQAPIDAVGNFSFTVPNGTYRVRVSQPGWTLTTPNPVYTVSLNNDGDISTGNIFGYGKNNRVYSLVFEDLNRDGVFNSGDTPRQGFVVNGGKAIYSNNVAVPIPDLSTVVSTITVPANGPTVNDLDVLINVSHTYDSDLEISLIGPDSTTIILSDNRGTSGDNFTNTVFDDAAGTAISAGTAPFTGRFRPDQLLSSYNNKLTPGLWQLRAADQAATDIGSILNWRMDFNTLQISTSDANGWAIMDVGSGSVTASIELPSGWLSTLPSDGKHTFTANGTPIFGKSYGVRVPTNPPSDIALSSNTISENAGVNALVGTLSSSDPDAGNTFTYTLVAGTGDTDNAAFNIEGSALRVSNSLDYETQSSYSLRVRSTNADGLFFEKVFTIIVTDVNEIPSDIALSSTTIPENAGVNAIVGTLSTTDPDAGDTFIYTLVAGTGDTDNTAFNIDGSTLGATNSFDFETQSSYSLRIRSTDAAGLFFEKIVAVNVSNVNEDPTDIALSSNTIAENSDANAIVGTLSTTDIDAGDTFTYTLVTGTGDTDNTAFNIDGSSLRATDSFDFEAKSNYSVRVRSTDAGGAFIEKVFTVNVSDVNDIPSDIALSSNTISENAGVNALIGTLNTTDQDTGDTFLYALVAGTGDTDNAVFNIEGAALRSTNALDYETKSSYSVRVRSTDAGGAFIEKVFTIIVTDVNEAPSDLDLSSNTIPENAGVNAIVGTLSTTDPDAGDTFIYTLVAGTGDTDNTAFNIDGSTLGATNSFDFETQSSYSLRIRSTDAAGLFFEKIVAVNVSNVNEDPTDIALSSNTIAENSDANAIVGTLSTTDIDAGDTFTYTLVTGTGDTDNTAFNIDGSSLRATDSFDFEAKSNYSVRVRSTDAGGAFIEKVFTVNVSDVNDIPSDIALSSNTISENAGVNALIGTLNTTDQDMSDTFLYALVAGTGDTDNAVFNIDGAALRSTNALDYETKSSYSVRVRSTDAGGAVIEKVFTVNVSDVNDIPSDVALSSNTIPENAGVNALVGTLNTTDQDPGDTFLYTLVAGMGDTDNTAFNIDGSSLRATNSFDFETKSSYSLRVRSTDAGGLFTEKSFVINVEDVREGGFVNGTNANDKITATYIGDGVIHTWSVQVNTGAAFNVSGDLIVDGLAGTDELQVVGRGVDDLYTLGGNQVVVNGATIQTTKTEVLKLVSGLGNDRVVIASAPVLGLATTVDTGGGTDLIETVAGSNHWSITGLGIGTLYDGAVSFLAVESVRGGSDDDRFTLGVNGRLTGQILGGSGADTLDLAAKTAANTINLQSNTATSTGGIAGIESFIGSSSPTLTDIFIGANSNTNWTIDGVNSGTLMSVATGSVSFSGFESLTGGTAADTFTFTDSGSLTRTLTGGTATGVVDTLSLAAKTVPLNIQLNTTTSVLGVLGTYTGIESLIANSVAGTTLTRVNNTTTAWAMSASGQITVSGVIYTDVPGITGGPGADTLTGPSLSTGISSWTIDSIGNGTLAIPTKSLMFTGMNNLSGGTGADSFEILPGGSLSGNLNAGTGTGFNSLSYSQWTSGVSVNLSATTVANATAISGLVSNMQMVTGGLGNDTLIGQAAKSTILIGLDGNDTLTGGSQRDLLLGGSGIDKLSGAAGDDLLVSGTTSYDRNRDALVAINSEWISTRTFALRTANIWGNGTGTRNNGDFQLNSNPSDSITDTVFADSDVDSLTGGLNQDWFFASLDDTTDLTGGALPDRLDR